MKYCPNCGQKLADEDIFCDNCGEKVADSSTLSTNENSTNTSNNYQPESSTMKELSQMGKMFTGIFVVCLVIGVFVMYNTSSVMKNEGSRNNSPSTSNSNSSRNSTAPPSSTSSSSQNRTSSSNNSSTSSTSSTYNHGFTDSNGTVYEGNSYDGYGFGIIEITRQKEIYCDFSRSPRASGMFHIVKFAVGNNRNEQILQGHYYLIDDRGRAFGSDINASSTYETMINFNQPYQINPGQAVIDLDVFDIPDNVNIVKARYEPFMYDGSIEVPYRVSTR